MSYSVTCIYSNTLSSAPKFFGGAAPAFAVAGLLMGNRTLFKKKTKGAPIVVDWDRTQKYMCATELSGQILV